MLARLMPCACIRRARIRVRVTLPTRASRANAVVAVCLWNFCTENAVPMYLWFLQTGGTSRGYYLVQREILPLGYLPLSSLAKIDTRNSLWRILARRSPLQKQRLLLLFCIHILCFIYTLPGTWSASFYRYTVYPLLLKAAPICL